MKKLLVVLPLVAACAACSSSQQTQLDSWVPNLKLKSAQGAGFGPYTVGEYQARVRAGQPGLSRIQEPVNPG